MTITYIQGVRRLGLKEAAIYIGRSESWVRRNLNALSIPHYKVGGRYEFSPQQLDDWVNACHRQSHKRVEVKEWPKLSA